MKVFTNGCFDVLHRAHVELLLYCHRLAVPVIGGEVIVGINSDESIKKLKGEDRPFNHQVDRQFVLKSLKFVDNVHIFEEDTPYELIRRIRPDIIVKGGDYKEEDVVGGDLCEVMIFDYIDGYSTTDALERMSQCPQEKKS
jgi:rfaE bifunctional protein nucleotidyltransferase chain/domain|tara:strand:- start:1185 stop:1607 length:423 start_codon:yes stop_codon:yes gene_type:complete